MQFIETLKLKDRTLYNLSLHNERMNRTRKTQLGCNDDLDLKKLIPFKGTKSTDIYKVRVIYSRNVEKIEIIPYQFPVIHSLKLVEGGSVNYGFKYLNRDGINDLFEKRDGCDDIIIIKEGYVTDSSFANLIFYDGSGWFTPSTPLLKGIQRTKLIAENAIHEKLIRPEEIKQYKMVKLINAFLTIFDSPGIDVHHISYT